MASGDVGVFIVAMRPTRDQETARVEHMLLESTGEAGYAAAEASP
jgi:hypothetical protein